MNEVILWGGTGQARVLREALAYADFQVVAIFDNQTIPSPFPDVSIHFGPEGFHAWLASRTTSTALHACVAIGGTRGSDRLSLLQWLQQQGVQPLTVIHPRAFVAKNALIGDGCQILAMSAVCANARLGKTVIVNTNASIDHDCVIGDGAHIAPGAMLAGEVIVGEFAFVGTGAIVLPGIRIGENAIVGAGSVVTRDVAAGEIVVGNPAKIHRKGNA